MPQGRTGDPVIVSSVRRYRLWIVAALVVSLVITFVLGIIAPAAGMIAPVLAFIVLGMGGYMVARTAIMRAKRKGGWYDDVPVRLVADVTQRMTATPIPFGWHLGSVVLLVIAAGIGVGAYPSLPNPLPIHWDLNGVANGYAEKSVWSVFGPTLIGFGLVALMFGLSFLIRMSPSRRIASDSPELAAHRAVAQQKLLGSQLGQITLITAALMSAISVFTWLAPSSAWFPLAATAIFLAFIAVTIAIYFVRYRRSMATLPIATDASAGTATPAHPSASSSHADAPDDDRFWKAGVFYVNRRDPALMVPKRFGVGWTINLGHPAGIAIGVAILVIIAVSTTLPIVFQGSGH